MLSADLTILSAGEIELVQRELNHAYSGVSPLLGRGSGFDLVGCNMVQESVLQQPLLVPEGSYREGEGEAGPPLCLCWDPPRGTGQRLGMWSSWASCCAMLGRAYLS